LLLSIFDSKGEFELPKIEVVDSNTTLPNNISKDFKKKNKNKTKKSSKEEIKKLKKKNSKRRSTIYDIDNFVIQNTAIRIHQKHERLDIPIPIFKEIPLLDDVAELDQEPVFLFFILGKYF
jgi:hypothetical protein